MQRLPVVSGGLASEQTTTATQEVKGQVDSSVRGSRGSAAGSILNAGDHMAAMPPFLFILLGGGILFYLVYKSHLTFAARVGGGK